MFLIETRKERQISVACQEISPKDAKSLSSPLAQRILNELALKESYPKEISKSLKVHEQKVYYHIHKMLDAGIIKPSSTKEVNGKIAQYYSLSSNAFAVIFAKEQGKALIGLSPNTFFSPFIENGSPNALLIIPSPIPHGSSMSFLDDPLTLSQFTSYLGNLMTSSNFIPTFYDTVIQKDALKKNLIIFGDIKQNTLLQSLNLKELDFEAKALKSSYSRRTYTIPSTGIIYKTQNPFSKPHQLLIISGLSPSGVRAAVLALSTHLKDILEGNKNEQGKPFKIVEGMDNDNDGIVDAVRVVE